MGENPHYKTMNATENNALKAKIIIRVIPLAIFISLSTILGMLRGYRLGIITNSDFILCVSVTSSAFFCFIYSILFLYFNATSKYPLQI